MLPRLTRVVAVGIAATLTSLGLLAAPTATAAPTTTPTSCSGVWVAVQFDTGAPVLGCATDYSDNTTMLDSAGFSVVTSTSTYGLSLDQIDAKPGTGTTFYWYQASAPIAADGSIGTWTAGNGFGVDTPDPTKISGFRLTDYTTAGWPPDAPEITSVPVATTPAPATPDPSTPPKDASPSDTTTAQKAAAWLATTVPDALTAAGSATDVGLSLATQKCSYATDLKKINTYLADQANDYSQSSAYAAGKLAVFADAVGEDPLNFGGVDLKERILAGAGSNGRLGSASDFSFGQALAMIGLKRAGTTPSDAMVDYLVGKQLASGAWGFGTTADPDTTALALVALSDDVITPTAATKAAVTKALAWAASNKKSDGYWTNYSPVDSTALLASALQAHGVTVTDSLTSLRGQQVKDGGFPNQLNGTTSNQMSTANALFALTSTTYATVSAPLASCKTSTSGSGSDASEDAATLPRTGSDASWPLGWAGLGLIVLGSVLVANRTERHRPRHSRR